MKRITPIALASVLTMLIAFAATHVRAQESNTNDLTYMTFNTQVELPGVTLEPGTYTFRLADTPSRNVVQVLRKDSPKPIGQWTFIPAERAKPADDTIVMFKEAGGTAPAVQYWFFPGEKTGKEFVYPKNQAQRIAARTGQTVRSDDGAVSPESARAEDPLAPASPPVVTAENRRDVEGAGVAPERAPSRDSRNLDQQNVSRNADAPSASAQARVDTPARESRNVDQDPIAQSPSAARPAPAPAQQQVARADELPRTASPLPLSGVIGALSLLGAATLRALRRG